MIKVNYKDEAENWLKIFKENNYAESTLAKKLAKLDPNVTKEFKGTTLKQKASIISKSLNLTSEEIKKVEEVKDDKIIPNCPIPIGTEVMIPNSYYNEKLYKLCGSRKISSRESYTGKDEIYLTFKNKNYYKWECHLSTLIDNFKNGNLRLHNPPKELETFKNSISNVCKKPDFTHNAGIWTLKNPKYLNFQVYPQPTNNCQLACVASMDTLIRRSSDFVQQLREIYNLTSKRILLCDISQSLKSNLYELINKDAIITETDYISTNNSKMCIILINLTKI